MNCFVTTNPLLFLKSYTGLGLINENASPPGSSCPKTKAPGYGYETGDQETRRPGQATTNTNNFFFSVRDEYSFSALPLPMLTS